MIPLWMEDYDVMYAEHSPHCSSRHFRQKGLRLIIAKKDIVVSPITTHHLTIVENHEIRCGSNPSDRVDHSTISAVLLVVFIPSYTSASFEKSCRRHERHREESAAAPPTTPPALRPSRRPIIVFDNKRQPGREQRCHHERIIFACCDSYKEA
jgi:hypothetical protein